MVVVIDTNVLVFANGREGNADSACVAACSRRLLNIRRNDVVALDDGWRILNEYVLRATLADPQRSGRLFLKWLLRVHKDHDRRHCHVVTISETAEGSFSEFPTEVALARFGRGDRKFVAVALKHGRRPPILHASDRGWWRFEQALAVHGVVVEHLCPELAPATARRPSRSDGAP